MEKGRREENEGRRRRGDTHLVGGFDCRREKWLGVEDKLLAHEGGMVIWEELEVGGARWSGTMIGRDLVGWR